jgi:hypothetical protein
MLIAEGLINNQVVARDTVRAQGAASTIKLVADPPVIEANCQDISRIEAYIVDANGTWIHSATNSVSWTLSGTGAELYGDNPISAQAGACIILAKATATPGTVTLQASSSGLTSQSVTITVVASGTTDVVPSLPVIRTEARASLPWHTMVRGNRFVLPAEIPLPAVIALYTVGGEQIYRGVALDRNVRIGDRRCLPFGVYIIKQMRKR